MKFKGELKFPEVDHPGVPVQFIIDGNQAELVVDDESLGRWSLYDVHARRLIASAFSIDLEGTEVTFVASDPIDFAYRGVEHMAETWATIKAKRLAARSLAIRKSRKGIKPSRIDDLRSAMESNLEAMEPGRLTQRPSGGLPGIKAADPSDSQPVSREEKEPEVSIPVVKDVPAEGVAAEAAIDASALDSEREALEEDRRRLDEERRQLDEQRRAAEEREANLVEAYRLEMQRLEAEREELRRHAGVADEVAPAEEREPEVVTEPVAEEPELERVAEESELEPVAEESDLEPVAEEPEPESEPEPVAEESELERVAEESELEPVAEEPELKPVAEEPEPESEPEPVAAGGVVDLNDYEAGEGGAGLSGITTTVAPQPETEPALAGAGKERKSGIMGAVKAAFRSGPRDHQHQFIEAPGGIGITRYVCEECGYVSISVGD